MKLVDRFLHATFWYALSSYGFFVLNFVLQIFLARLLLPELFGIYAFALAIKEVLTMLINFGNTQGFIHGDCQQSSFNALFCLGGLMSVINLLLGVGGFFVLLHFYNFQYGILFLFIMMAGSFSNMGNVYFAPLEHRLSYKGVALSRNGVLLAGNIVALMLAIFQFGIYCFIAKELLAGALLFLCGYYLSDFRLKGTLDKKEMLKQAFFNLKILLARSCEILFYRTPDLLAQFLFGKKWLGNFYQGRYPSYMSNKLLTPFVQDVLFSFSSRLKEDRKSLSQYLYYINYLIVRALLPLAVSMACFGAQIFVFIYGQKWLVAGEYFRQFSLFIFFLPIFSSLIIVLYSLAKQWVVSLMYALLFFVFIAIAFLWMRPQYLALIFSSLVAVGYFGLAISLYFYHVRIKIVKLFFRPVIILIISGISAYYQTISFGFFVFCAAYLLMLLLEYNEISLILKRIWQSLKEAKS